MAGGTRKKMKKKLRPEILIFDVDGVLVDVRGTYWRSELDTVRHITGKRVTYTELHRWKSKPGFNDDWSMVSAWVSSLGHPTSYEEARAAFERFYWGSDGKPGNVRNEKLIVTPRQIEKWAENFELNLFTGRTRQEFFPHHRHHGRREEKAASRRVRENSRRARSRHGALSRRQH